MLRPSIVVGLLLVLVSGLLAWRQSEARPAPMGTPVGMGFIMPPPLRHERGLYVRVRARVDGCHNPVQVTVLGGGSAEYWHDQPIEAGLTTQVGFAVDDPGVRNLRLRLAHVDEADETMIPPAAPVREFAPPGVLSGVSTSVMRVNDAYAVKLIRAKIKRFHIYQPLLIASFDADWIGERDGTSCFLQLPALVGYGADCALAVPIDRLKLDFVPLLKQGGEGRPLCDPGREQATSASTLVEASGAHVDATASQPAPGGPDLLRWSCSAERTPESAHNRLLAVIESDKLAPAPQVYDLHHSVTGARNCAANVVLAEDGADSRRTFLLIVYGAIIGLGLTLVVEGARAGWAEASGTSKKGWCDCAGASRSAASRAMPSSPL